MPLNGTHNNGSNGKSHVIFHHGKIILFGTIVMLVPSHGYKATILQSPLIYEWQMSVPIMSCLSLSNLIF